MPGDMSMLEVHGRSNGSCEGRCFGSCTSRRETAVVAPADVTRPAAQNTQLRAHHGFAKTPRYLEEAFDYTRILEYNAVHCHAKSQNALNATCILAHTTLRVLEC